MTDVAYTTWGSARGCCDHEHPTLMDAEHCRAGDARGCRTQGGYSDRRVRIVRGDWRSYDTTTGPGRIATQED